MDNNFKKNQLIKPGSFKLDIVKAAKQSLLPDTTKLNRQVGKTISLNFREFKKMNCIVLMENMSNGQHVEKFELELLTKSMAVNRVTGTTIGRKRILTFPAVEVNGLVLSVLSKDSNLGNIRVEAFLIDENLIEK